MSKATVARNFAFAILAGGLLAACAQTQADTGLSSRVDTLESKVNQMQTDMQELKSDMAATRQAAEKAQQSADEANMASQKMQSSYNKSMRTK